MESFFSRYRNLVVLVAALLLQVIGLAVQVRKAVPAEATGLPGAGLREGRSVQLIRLWAADMVTPFERGIHGTGQGLSGLWSNYIDLRHTRDENKELQKTIDRLRLEQATLLEDARRGQRLQALEKFREGYIYATTPAQVIGTSGNSQSHVLWLDKGADSGFKPDMAVITGDGIVGKVRDVFEHTAQVLVINDQTSGAGVVLQTTRIRGILRGNAAGQPQVINILADARIQPGEPVLTAGGDQIFPRGLPVGAVDRVERDRERGSFINVIVKPAAKLDNLDEVLVITSLQPQLSPQQMADLKTSEELKGAEVAADIERKKAAAEMAERLPGLVDPNAPVPATPKDANGKPIAPAIDPKTGQPVPVPPVIPKALPAKHPDRFSPAGMSGNGADVGPSADTGQDTGRDVTTVAAKSLVAGKKPTSAPVATAKPAGHTAGAGVKTPAPKPLKPKSGVQ